MSLRSWLARKLVGTSVQRAAAPIDLVPRGSLFYGPGASAQADHATLLAESLGIPDAAARAIANRISTLIPEVKVTRRTQDGTTEDEILDDHPLKLLLDRPHPNFSRRAMLRLTAQYIVTVGEAYWIKVGSGLGVPIELHPVMPTMVQPLVVRNAIQGYQVTDATGQRTVYPARDMLRFWFPDPENPWRSEGYLGPSGIQADAHKFASQHLRSHYQHDANPKTTLEVSADAYPFNADDQDRFYALWREHYSSRDGSRAGLPAILPTGYKLIELMMQSGSDVTPLLEYFRDDLLMSYATPRSVLGQVVSGDRSSAETNQWVFDRYAVTPVAELIADTLTLQLASDFDSSIKVEFCPFVSEDKDHELKREAQDLTQMVRSVNEVRTDRGLDEVTWGEQPIGTTGDVPFDPVAAAERANRPPQPAPGVSPPAVPKDEDEDEIDERSAHIELRKRFRAKRREAAAARRYVLERDSDGAIKAIKEESAA